MAEQQRTGWSAEGPARLEPQVLSLFKVAYTTPRALVQMLLCAAPQEWEGEEFRPLVEPGRKQGRKAEQA